MRQRSCGGIGWWNLSLFGGEIHWREKCETDGKNLLSHSSGMTQLAPNWFRSSNVFNPPPSDTSTLNGLRQNVTIQPTLKSIPSSSKPTSPYSAARTLQPNYPSHLINTFDSGPCKPKKPPIQIPPISFSIFSPTEFPPKKRLRIHHPIPPHKRCLLLHTLTSPNHWCLCYQ